MCGILGELRCQADSSGADWPRLTRAMARRGPDDEGLWSADETCTLAFRRLSILDLTSTAHQPMVSADGQRALVFNGELYNFRDLRSDLSSCGYKFRSTGDAEVVLAALCEWGHRALERFNGMFALAFYSSRDRTLLVARDHAGIKPVYVLRDPRGWVFASQFDQLLAHPWRAGRNYSEVGRALYLRLGYIPAPHAMLDGIEMLEAGTWLQVRPDGREESGRFFEFPRHRMPDLAGTSALEAIDDALSGAVKRQMVSDVPVGSLLSGGIDSPLITSEMARTGCDRIPAFTIGTEDLDTDESAAASRYAAEIGVEHVALRATPAAAVGLVTDVVKACGEPFADYSIFPTMLVSQLAASRVKVVLSGDGGDELFFGYASRFASVLRVAEQFAQPAWLRDVRWGLKKYTGIGSATLDSRRPSIGEWYRSRHSHISEERLSRIFPSLGAWPSEMRAFTYHGWETDETAQWLRWNEYQYHLSMVLLKVDRASMYNSLEVRVPLLDREVIDVALRTDWRSLLDLAGPLGKLALRQLLQRRVSTPSREKRGFSVPMGDWLRGALRPLVEERLLNRGELAGLEVNGQELHRWFNEHLAGGVDHAWGVWVLLSLALWEDEYMARRG